MYLNQYLKYLFIIFLILPVLAFITFYGMGILDGGNSWQTGDWLINYESGFVRRGLLGQFFFILSQNLDISLLYISFFFQSLIYLMIVYLVLKLFFKKNRDIFWVVFLISPAFVFFFPFYDLQGGFRKEILGFMAFLVLLHGELLKSNLIKSTSLFLFFIAVYSHEMNALLIPFFLYVLIINSYYLIYSEGRLVSELKLSSKVSVFFYQIKSTGNLIYIIAFSLISFTGIILSAIFIGENYQGKIICDSLVNSGLDNGICSGAIAWIGRDSSYGLGLVISNIHTNGYAFYIVYFFFSILPFLLFKWFYRKNTLILVFVAFLALSPLFVVAIDWGRWIHVFIFMITTLFLYESLQDCEFDEFIIELPVITKLMFILSYLFWTMPHCCGIELRFGLFEVLLKISSKIL